MAIREIDLVYRTMFAELGQRCMDAQFINDFKIEEVGASFSVDGYFRKVRVKDREYWYHKGPSKDGRRTQAYVGPVADNAITSRVMEFERIKDDIRGRRKLVATLVRDAGVPAPERFTGDVVDALAAEGLFRLRAVLVGTVAFQCYPGLLGIRLPSSTMQTGDADFAQFHSVSAAVEDTIPPMLEVLRGIDPTFREIPSLSDPRLSTQFENQVRYKVEFLTPNTGSDDYEGRPARMPALGGASAMPLRFLDFLIHEPVRSVMLHKGGIPVLVPSPQRYAVHKLIVSTRRTDDEYGHLKSDKDVQQAKLLMEALIQIRRQDDLAEAFSEAWNRGPAWRDGILKGMSMIQTEERDRLKNGLIDGMEAIGEDPAEYCLREPSEAMAP